VVLDQPVPFQIPEALDQLINQIPAKDRERIREAVRRLHDANGELWSAEDQVRTATDVEAVGLKRAIDQLNRERNGLIDRIDEAFTHLSTRHLVRPSTPVHTETLGSVIDRFSVVTLRERRAQELTDSAAHAVAADRLPHIRAQRSELARSIADLAADLSAGARRLPDGRKFKLYGNIAESAGEVIVSPNIDQVIALGGLSECGKSSSGEYLRYVDGTYRLKMSFLIDLAARRGGVGDPYQLDRPAQAGLLLEGLNAFADMHVEARRFTIESVHSDELIFALKQLLGDRLLIVYLDVPAHLRAARSETSRAALRVKDDVKTSRGAHRVAAGADHLIDNSGSITALHARLRMIAFKDASSAIRVEPAAASFLPARVADAIDRCAASLANAPAVEFMALTGSSVDGVWLPAWSDIDVLISADHSAHPVIVQEVHALQAHLMSTFGIGCAVTLVTPGEIRALLVQPRVVYSLSRLSDGRSPALFANPALRLLQVTRDKIRHAATQDLPLVVVTLRRLLAAGTAEPSDLRTVYKHIVLLARLLLRSSGFDATGSDAIVDMSEVELTGLGSLNLPPVAVLAQAYARDDASGHAEAVSQAAHSLLGWYAQQVNPENGTAETASMGACE
jgi:predicted nucleotidyltransferase